MSTSSELNALRKELADLRSEFAALKHGQSTSATEPGSPRSGSAESEQPLSRRNWLKSAGAAAVGGAAAVVATAQPVLADDPDDLTLGETKTSTGRTQANFTGDANGVGFLVQAGIAFAASQADFPAALGAYATRSEQPTGLYGFSNQGDGYGVVGSSALGTGVLAQGRVAAMRLGRLVDTAPPDRSDAHLAGEIEPSSSSGGDDLWTCVADGSPGTWRKLAGPATAGSLHPIDPGRVYDSRRPAPLQGRINTGQSRLLSVADGRDLTSGAVTVADLVPEGATAVAFNLTITATELQGFLSVTPGDAATFKASSINWFDSNQILANAGIAKLDDSRQIKVFCGGGGRTNFVVDVTGYYL